MKNWFRTLSALALCTVILFTSGCATNPTTSSAATSAAPSAAEKTATKTEEVGKNYAFRVAATDEAWRAENIIAAAKKLNEQLAAEGSKDTVSVEYEVVEDFSKTLDLWMKENKLPEIIAQTGGTIYNFSQAGALVDCSYVVNDEVYSKKVAQNLRDMGKINGTYYGIIQDLEVRFVIVYKPALQKLGWTDAQIDAWKADARAGKITTKDLQELAKKVVDAGICEYGITHRPNKGADWRYTFVTWNHGKSPLNDKGQVVINRQNIIDFLTYWRQNVQMGITPYNHLTDFNWDMLEGDIWPKGKSFCWYGQAASKSDIMSSGGVTSDYVDKNYFTIPLPVSSASDKPVGGCNPGFYGLTTASQKDKKTAEYCRRILDNVLAPELQLISSVGHTHVAITQETMDTAEYKKDAWMNDISYMTAYMFTLQGSKYMSMYGDSQEFFNAIQQAEVEAKDSKAKSVETIADELIQKITFNMGEGNYVLEK